MKERITDSMVLKNIKPMGFFSSLLYFAIPTLMLYAATQVCIPRLHHVTDLPQVVCWYICGGSLVFFPLFLGALILYRLEGNPWRFSMILQRFRLNTFGWRIAGISLLGTIAISLLMFLLMEMGKWVSPDFSAQPSFISLKPLEKGDYWILLVWLPLFFFNIMGEALFWRGYIFPRQEAAFGKFTWLVHGLLWTIFHASFGWNLMFNLLPILFITSYLVQITRNTWVDILIHTLINGSGFLLIAFGIVR